MPKDSNVFVVVGEDVVTVKREGSNRAVLAKVLGKVQVDGSRRCARPPRS